MPRSCAGRAARRPCRGTSPTGRRGLDDRPRRTDDPRPADPGHRPDHLAFLLADGTLLAGDTIVDGEPLVIPPEGDPTAQGATLSRLAAMAASGEIKLVIPGHGPVADAGAVPALRPG